MLSPQGMKEPPFTCIKKLSAFLELSSDQQEKLIPASPFPLLLPMRLAKKIKKKSLDDPILRQFVPHIDEHRIDPLFLADPVGEKPACRTPRLLQKYPGRALLLTSTSCPMHCRFCFRRAFDYPQGIPDWEAELAYLHADSTIHEVILSGGDPLSLSNRTFARLLTQLEAIPHLTRLRIHTRFPIADPNRIDAEFADLLHKTRFQVWFVLHTNHPQELGEDLFISLRTLRCPILAHTVLLRGVNDSPAILAELFENLVDHGIFPYYLHQLDRVEGATHFEVPIAEGKAWIMALTALLPGYAIPKFVQELPGYPSKTRLET